VDVSQLLLVLISCLMFVLVVRTLVRSWGERPGSDVRLVRAPGGEQWLDVEQVAELLDSDPGEVMVLVERRAIPFFVEPGASRASPRAYWFRRDEIDAWVVG
jgi:hypothetical protein